MLSHICFRSKPVEFARISARACFGNPSTQSPPALVLPFTRRRVLSSGLDSESLLAIANRRSYHTPSQRNLKPKNSSDQTTWIRNLEQNLDSTAVLVPKTDTEIS